MSEQRKRRYLVGGGHGHGDHGHSHGHDHSGHGHEGHDHGNAARSEAVEADTDTDGFLDAIEQSGPSREEIKAPAPLSEEENAARSETGLALLPSGDVKATKEQVDAFIDFALQQSGDTNSYVLWDASFESEAYMQQVLPELQERFDAAKDPEERLALWSILHVQTALEDYNNIPDGEAVEQDADEAHRASQQVGMYYGRIAETDEEVAAMRRQIDSGNASAADIDALAERKLMERRLENTYGVDFRNLPDDFSKGQERRVWTVSELEQIESALERMPVDHLRDNKGLNEIVRSDVRRDEDEDGSFHEDLDTGADAGGGQITFYDTGTGEVDQETGETKPLEPWRLPSESALAGHDASNPTTLVEEVLSHEVGHTVHQSREEHYQTFLDMNGWGELSKDQLIEKLTAVGYTKDNAIDTIQAMDDSRDEYYGDQVELNDQDGIDFQIDPYSDGYIESNTHAVPDGESWDYADSNASDHYAEMYTKAVHAPEELALDLLERPAEYVQQARTSVELAKEDVALAKESDDTSWQEAAQAGLEQAQADHENATAAAALHRKQWTFFRTEVFGTDDSDIQGLQPTGGNNDALEAYQTEAGQAMTPHQLESVRARHADRI